MAASTAPVAPPGGAPPSNRFTTMPSPSHRAMSPTSTLIRIRIPNASCAASHKPFDGRRVRTGLEQIAPGHTFKYAQGCGRIHVATPCTAPGFRPHGPCTHRIRPLRHSVRDLRPAPRADVSGAPRPRLESPEGRLEGAAGNQPAGRGGPPEDNERNRPDLLGHEGSADAQGEGALPDGPGTRRPEARLIRRGIPPNLPVPHRRRLDATRA